jgi:hypothetical protein
MVDVHEKRGRSKPLPPELRRYPRKPEEFETIKQEGASDCGAAVAAMAAGVSLAEAKLYMRVSRYDGHFVYRTREVARYLAWHGMLLGLSMEILENPINKHMLFDCSWDMANSPALLVVKSHRFDGMHHWVLWDGKNVRDPSPKEPELTKLKDYEVTDIYPICQLVE